MADGSPVIPGCASCGARWDASRVVDEERRTVYRDAWVDQWSAKIACPDCLSISEVAFVVEGVRAALVAPGTTVTRLRDALRAAFENDSLRRLVGRLMTDEKEGWLAAVPELFPELLPGIGRHLRLRTNLELHPPLQTRPAALGPGHPAAEVWGGPISRRRQRTAVTGDGPGGVIPGPDVRTGDVRVPVTGPLLLVGLRLTVVGVRPHALVVELPGWAAGAVGAERVQIPWGSAQRVGM